MFRLPSRLALACVLASEATTAKASNAEGGAASTDAGAASGEAAPASTNDATVEIRGSRELPVRLYDPERRTLHPTPVLRCTTPCRALLDRRQYKLVIDKTSTTVSGTRLVRIDRDSELLVHPPSLASRNLWGTIAVLGTTAVIFGTAIFVGNAGCDASSSPCSGSVRGTWIGATLVLAGLPSSIIGWIVYADTFGIEVGVRPLNAAPVALRSKTGRSESYPSGAALDLRLSF